MSEIIEELERQWHDRLVEEANTLSDQERKAIVCWLVGEDRERWQNLEGESLATARAGLNYRWQILQKRYLKVNPTRAYRNLLDRLSGSVTLRQKIRTWVSLSRDRQRAVADVLQEVIQEMLQGDRYLQTCMTAISQYPIDRNFQNTLLFATLEEYALRPIRNQPLLAYRFVNYLRRQSKSGMTNVPREEMIRVLSDEIATEEGDGAISLLDRTAVSAYEDERVFQENQTLRARVRKTFSDYLLEKLGEDAVMWLNLYLSGQSQEAIARAMNLTVQQVYRLREKVGYHAIKVFALKEGTEIVSEWLEISPQEHNFGLTPAQWQSYYQGLNDTGRAIIDGLKAGRTLEDIAESLHCKRTAIGKEWARIYAIARDLRDEGRKTENVP
jgi:hypothetical protein